MAHFDIKCEVCGCEFARVCKPSKKPRHCSKSCTWAATKGPEYNAKISRSSAVARAASQRGKGTRGYVKLMGRHEHRVVAEKKLGRPLAPGEVVHHIDENKHNNSPENLEIITQAEHMRAHGLGIKGMFLHWEPWKHKGKRA